MKSLRLSFTALLFLIAASPSFAAAAYVKSVIGGDTATVSITPIAGDDLIVMVYSFNGASTFTSVTDSVGGVTVLTDLAFASSGTTPFLGLGVFRVHGATAVSHTFTANWSVAPSDFFLIAVEASGIVSIDSGAGSPSIATGTSATATTASLTPSQNGDFLIASVAGAGSGAGAAWSNGFTQAQAFVSGPSFGAAYLVQGSAASVNTAWSPGFSAKWAAALVAYTPTGGTVTNGVVSSNGHPINSGSSVLFK